MSPCEEKSGGEGLNMPDKRQRVTTCLWFDDQAEAAATFYT